MMPLATGRMQFKTWGSEARLITDIYNLEDGSRKASHQFSALEHSSVCLSSCAWPVFCVYFPTVVKTSTVKMLMGWELCSERDSSFLVWQYYKFEGARLWRIPGGRVVRGSSCMQHGGICITGGDKLGYFYSTFNRYFPSASFVEMCVIVSDPKDRVELFPLPGRPVLGSPLQPWPWPLVFSSCCLGAELASQPKHFPEGRQRVGQPYLETLRIPIRGLSSIKCEFMALKIEGWP